MSNEKKWTDARWRVDSGGDEICAVVEGYDVVIMTLPKTVCHGSTMTGAWMETEGQEADLHRAVECFNACRDMDDPAAEIAKLRASRDECVAALIAMRNTKPTYSIEYGRAEQQADAAIANAERT